ncbi:hypothetical protein [Myxococcus sp. CA040A]|uniref:hypothetical protein n=1 Tax=Myxococcus sp. CA040A TaxID=2741738 RepID=UPI00157B0A96|nr:hypothetical protein [Myxococcus sp. CA040A]NTX09050.1 hypothetical protein [Myxococcus sp. CA040A]
MQPIQSRVLSLLGAEPAPDADPSPKAAPPPRSTTRTGNVIEAFPTRSPTTTRSSTENSAAVARTSRAAETTPAEDLKPAPAAEEQPSPKAAQKGFFSRIGSAVGGVVRRVADGVGGLVTGVVEATVGTLRNTVESVRTVFSGLGNIFTGRFREGFTQLGQGLIKGVQTPLDATLVMGGRAISAVQTLLGIEPVRRSLTDDEVAALRTVYGDSIDYSRISIKEGDAGLLTLSKRPFTHGDTTYIPSGHLPLQLDLLVHEVAHVWQHQNGGTDYMSEALFAQVFGDGYNVLKALRKGKAWEEMNPEQQAELLELGFKSGHIADASLPLIIDGVDYTAQLNAALHEVRAGRGAP